MPRLDSPVSIRDKLTYALLLPITSWNSYDMRTEHE